MKTVAFCLIGMLASLSILGCGPTNRFVTAKHWTEDGKHFYLAFYESTKEMKVKACTLLDNNTLTCVEQEEITKLSNKK